MNFIKMKYSQKSKIYYHNEMPKTKLLEYALSLFHGKNMGRKCSLVREMAEGGRQVYRLELEDQVYYLKKFQYRKAKKVFKNLFRPEEAVRCLEKLYRLSAANIAVVNPVAAITYRRTFFSWDSILITKEFKGVTLHQYLLNVHCDRHTKDMIIKNLAELLAKFFNNQFLHKDYRLINFMIDPKNHTLVLVDVDNIYFAPFLPEKLFITYLARFNVRLLVDLIENDLNLLSSRERILFYKEFVKNCRKKISLKGFVNKTNRATIKRLIEIGRTDLILKDKWLTNIYYFQGE